MKTILQVLVLFSFISVQAQLTLTDEHGDAIVDNSTITVEYDPQYATAGEGVFECHLESTNNNDINVRILESSELAPAVNFFCSIPGLCYPPNVTNKDIELQDDNSIGFSFHYDPNNNLEDVTIKYRLAEVGNSANDIVFYVKYVIIDATNILDNSNSINKIKAYPNPANQFANIVYDLNEDSEMVLYNILGEKVESHLMNRGEGSIQINTAKLQSGTYIYQIITNSEIKSTKYLIVNH